MSFNLILKFDPPSSQGGRNIGNEWLIGMRDRNGIEVRVEYLEWQETYWGWIEGEPEHMNEVILKEHLPHDLARWPHTPHLVLRAEERAGRKDRSSSLTSI